MLKKTKICVHFIELSSPALCYYARIVNISFKGAMLQAGRSRVRLSMRSLIFFSAPNPSGRTMALGFTQTLTEMSTR
jgi:hypothetical protein